MSRSLILQCVLLALAVIIVGGMIGQAILERNFRALTKANLEAYRELHKDDPRTTLKGDRPRPRCPDCYRLVYEDEQVANGLTFAECQSREAENEALLEKVLGDRADRYVCLKDIQ